jgi:DNA polymerase III delta prime subunit
MTVEAQGMLRQTIEKNSATTRFCLICNDIDKINIALQSRCSLFRFPPLNVIDMIKRLEEICSIENINYDKNAIEAIIKITKGDMRAAINTLQQVKLTVNKKITTENVYKVSGYCMPQVNIDIFNILVKLSKHKKNLTECIEEITEIVVENNITIFNLLEELKNIVMSSNFTINQKIFLIDGFANNEIYDAVNVDPKNILMIISSLFVLVNDIK